MPIMGVAFAAFCVWLTVRIVNRRERWAKWIAIAMVLTTVLYVLSSGPLTMVAFHTRVMYTPVVLQDGTPAVEMSGETSYGRWFPVAYAPLFWIAGQRWGRSLNWYWDLFPHDRTVIKL